MAERAITSVNGLADAGLISRDDVLPLQKVEDLFATRLTQEVIQQIAASGDVIAGQYVPQSDELYSKADELTDPIGDDAHSPAKGVVHRYPDRLLFMPTLTCAVYCRFCFRREKVGQGEGTLTKAEYEKAFSYIASRPEVREVILTGGDPLILSDRRLAEIMQRLSAIRHIQVIRLHTRVPLVEPTRITPGLVKALKARPAVYMGLHVNHVAELTVAVRKAIARLAKAMPLLSQTVLLKGVNDSAEALEALFRALIAIKVRPYYLHQLDKAEGTSHFRVPIEQGQDIMRRLRGRVSGIALPTYILDIPGGHGKVPIGPDYLSENEIADPKGRRHRYLEF